MCFKRWIKKMAVLDHFLFNSDYPTDKIAFAYTGTMTINKTFQPMIVPVDTGISTLLYAEGDYKVSGSNRIRPLNAFSGESIIGSLVSYMNNGKCYIAPYWISTDSSNINKTIEFRIWGFYDEASAKNINMSKTASVAKPVLVFNSDENYPRFIGDGFISQGQTYTHNLGYIPLVKTWRLVKNNPIPLPGGTLTVDTYSPLATAYFGNPNTTSDPYRTQEIQVSRTTIKTYTDSSAKSGEGLYYRMYVL